MRAFGKCWQDWMREKKWHKVRQACLRLALWGPALAWCFAGGVWAAEELSETGPLYHEFGLTLESGRRREMLGPFWSAQETADGKQWAVPPLISYERVESTGWEQFDFLYPLFTRRRVGEEWRAQFFQLFSIAGGGTVETNVARRFTVFPFYFQQRSSDPTENYTALLPFYGHLQNRFSRDSMTVVGFPLYLRSWRKDVRTDNYLFPFVHVREGSGLHGWQALPLAGHEHKEITTFTNIYGENETVAGHDKWFALWPLVAGHKTGIGTAAAETNVVALPFYTSLRSAARDQTTWLWPFFTSTEDRENDFREWAGPWPFFTKASGAGRQGVRFWPLFGRIRKPKITTEFMLWPLYKRSVIHSPPLHRKRTRIGFLVYTDLTERNLETGTEKKRLDVWPLFARRQGADGSWRLQIFAPLEPWLAGNSSVQRNYSPLWSVWRQESNPAMGRSSASLLWNTYRRETDGERRKCSILFGLFKYQASPEGSDLRLFYIPISHHVPKHR